MEAPSAVNKEPELEREVHKAWEGLGFGKSHVGSKKGGFHFLLFNQILFRVHRNIERTAPTLSFGPTYGAPSMCHYHRGW